ncbi:MAG: hypothetical protein Q9215_008142, partial [Flavoplaca cf. flavocitrina]
MEAYNESLSLDKAFYAEDIDGSIAWARANKNAGILTEEEFKEIERGFGMVQKEWDSDSFQIKPGVDERLWLRKKLHEIEDHLTSLLKVIVSRAENDIDLLLPGYTHLQRAQPVRWSHWLLSYGACFARDLRALEFVIQELNYCPLGCGALSGNVFNIDRRAIADELGFKEICMNSMDAVSDRDFLLKTMGWGSDFMLHVSRIAEDLCIYSSQEFGFVKLADAYSTGSSLMPQKKNPDALELLRGKSGTMHGIHSGFRMTLNALPSTYNKDMQE